MSNYSQVTFFAPKDALLSGDPNKIIHGTQVDPELAAIATAISSKFDVQNMGSIVQLAIGSGAVGAPSYSFAADTTTGWYLSAVGVLAAATGGVQRVTIGSSGNWTINAAASGSTLTVNGAANNYAETITASSTAGQSFGMIISAGTNASDDALVVRNQSGSSNFLVIGGNGAGTLGPSGSLGLSWNTSGDITIPVPSSGVALTINPVAGSYALQIPATAGNFAAISLQGNGASLGNNDFAIFSNTDSSANIAQKANAALNIYTNNLPRVAIAAAGTVVINAPASGIALTVNNGGTTALQVNTLDNTAGVNFHASAATNGQFLEFTDPSTTRGYVGNGPVLFSGQVLSMFGLASNAGILAFSVDTGSTIAMQIQTTRAVIINAPTAGNTALTVNGLSAQNTATLSSTGAASQMNFGWAAGISGAAWNLYTSSTDPLTIGTQGNTTLSLATNNTVRATIGGLGNVIVNAPASGDTFKISGISGQNALVLDSNANNADPRLQFNINGTFWSLIGVSSSAGNIITSSAVDDLNIRAQGANINFSGNSGTNIFFQINKNTTAPILQGYGPTAAALVDMTPDTGSFTGTLTGFTTTVTGTCVWSRNGNQVMLFLPVMTGTSNTNTMTLTGLPAAIGTTARANGSSCAVESGSAGQTGQCTVSGNVVTFYTAQSSTGFQNTLTKGISVATTVSWILN